MNNGTERFRRQPGHGMRRSSFLFCAILAALAVLARLVAFDYLFFGLEAIPNHDMYQGAAFFTTSMHSIALCGDLAWWNPIGSNGYAQYYQAFLSPLAPTPHSVVFILWGQAIWVLSLGGVRIPEYYQYLVITYIVLPFLAFLALGVLASLIFRRRAVVVLILIVYCFSGMGLWNSAWFYFQEPASLFFLFAAAIAAARRPSPPRLLLVLLAVLNLVTSVNYWTLYNSWFVVIFLGSYLLIYHRPLRRLASRLRSGRVAPRTTLRADRVGVMVAIGLSLGAIALWAVIIGSIVSEQAGNYVRGVYSISYAYALVAPLRYITFELFNPEIDLPLRHYRTLANDIHHARYIGAVLAPLLVVWPLFRWERRDRWLLTCAIGTLVICLAPPFLLSAWAVIPLMNRVVHVFYMYSTYWQLMLVLLAGASLDRLLGDMNPPVVRRALHVVVGMVIVIVGTLGVAILLNTRFEARDVALEAVLRCCLLIAVPCMVLIQRFLFDSPEARRLLAGSVIVLAFADLTRYFYDVSLKDKRFTGEERYAPLWSNRGAAGGARDTIPYPLPTEIRRALRAVWAAPDRGAGFTSNVYGNMPVPSHFWPVNIYMRHRYLLQEEHPTLNAIKQGSLSGPPIEFFCGEDVRPIAAAEKPGGPDAAPQGDRVLWLADPPKTPEGGERVAPVVCGGTGERDLATTWRAWSYNGFEIDVDARRDGFLFLRQIADPLWRIEVDGKPVTGRQANVAGLAIPVTRGRHSVRMDYRPLARRLYWPACVVLEAAWLAVLIAATGVPRRRRVSAV